MSKLFMVEINFIKVQCYPAKKYSKWQFHQKRYFKKVKEHEVIFIHTHFI